MHPLKKSPKRQRGLNSPKGRVCLFSSQKSFSEPLLRLKPTARHLLRTLLRTYFGKAVSSVRREGMQLFWLTVGSFLLSAELFAYSCVWELLCLRFELFFAYSSSFFSYNWSFLAYSGKVRLRSTSSDCKQRSSTVSRKAPILS